MMPYPYGYTNPRYGIADAPRSVRKRWARQAAMTRLRNKLAACRMHLDEAYAIGGEIPLHERAKAFGKVHRTRGGLTPAQRRWEGLRETAANPELLVVRNPGRRMKMRRRKKRRGRRRNAPLTVRHGGRNLSWRSLVKKMGVKRASKIWKRRKYKRHGSSRRVRCVIRRKRRRAANPRKRKCYVRYKGRRRSWRGLVRIMGVKKASKMWRKRTRKTKRRKRARNRGGVRRRRRRFRRR